MEIKYKICCHLAKHFEIKIVSRGMNKWGDPNGVVRLSLWYGDLWIKYCPFCGTKVELEIIEPKKDL